MTAVFVVVAMAVVGTLAVLIARDRPLIVDDPVGAPGLRWAGGAGVSAGALTEVRFTVALRGYRMEQVDQVLDDTRAALIARDEQIAALQRAVATLGQAPVADEAAR
jgi:DivIVA domain-containing protein